MKIIILFLSIAISCLSCRQSPKSLSKEEKEKIQINYESLKSNIQSTKAQFYSKQFDFMATKSYIFKILKDSIFPAWEGTEWDFNGTTQIPRKGEIACGYFVMTCLQDAGFVCDRIKFAQQASSKIIYSFSDPNDVKIFGNNDFKGLYKYVKKHEDEIFIVGLDNHVGFIVNDNGFIYCVHSTAWPQKAVAIEPLAISKVFMDSKVHYTGKPLNSKSLLKKWRVNEKIEMK